MKESTRNTIDDMSIAGLIQTIIPFALYARNKPYSIVYVSIYDDEYAVILLEIVGHKVKTK